MKAGKEVHALIENGLYDAKKRFDMHEQRLTISCDNGYVVLGIPDSYSLALNGVAEFVDYKTGKSSDWHKKLPNDLKMKCTAWLVWRATDMPSLVRGYVEYIPTIWDAENHEVIPSDEPSTIYQRDYTAEELLAFTDFIIKTIDQINNEYPKWLISSTDFVSDDDVNEYVTLDQQIKELSNKQEEIKERIKTQLEFGDSKTLEVSAGSFYIMSRSKWVYPKDLIVKYSDSEIVLSDVEAINEATSIAKKEFEQVTPPASVSTSLGFRAKKQKK